KRGGRHVDDCLFPTKVQRIYRETVTVFNAGTPTLAGGGLRAIVEAVCNEQRVAGKNLQEKIDQLVAKGLLARAQADWLHEERYIGNAALHEIEPPDEQHLESGLEIIEGLLNTIYILPKQAEKLKNARTSKTKHPTP